MTRLPQSDSGTIVRVALPLPLPQAFDYLSGPLAAQPGCRVRVPFGRSHKTGVVLETTLHADIAVERLKPIDALLDAEPLIDAVLLADLRRAADYWCGAIGDVVFGALPLALREGRAPADFATEAWRITLAGTAARDARTRRGASAALLDVLGDAIWTANELDSLLPGWRAASRRLATAGLIERAQPARDPPHARDGAAPILTDEQADALATLLSAGEGFHPYLLQGVTGSGKTEIYLRLTERALQQGHQALWLVPEIGLVPQALRRLRARFDARIAVLHSNLAEGDRARAWLDARSGDAAIVLGTRSAVFAPLPRAGLIIVDEEHDASYKQQEGFRYHARDFALMRAQSLGVPVVLGSATPSLETLANVDAGRYVRVRLHHRVHARPPSPVHVLDLRGLQLAHGLSPALLDALDACIARGEQALVFKNRRGYAPVLLCHACGWHAACPRCEKPLTLYRGRRQLLCHHCGHGERAPETCPHCSADALIPQGQGTERLEEALTARYPDVPVLRVDRDSTRRRDAFAKVLDRLADGKPAILVGTQILAKGHDLPNLTTVAIVGVDEGLHSADFHADERLAQLIVQVAGRAGRADKPGEVWLQTHEPDHPLLATLLKGGHDAATAMLLGERLASELPPFAHLALLRAECRQRDVLDGFMAAARSALASIERMQPQPARIRVHGPVAAPMPLRAGRHRAQLLLESAQRPPLRQALAHWLPELHALPQPRGLRWSLDVDPVDLY
ncbi:MAG: Helicase PriA essential for oriC/DnaA-independent DNA replication [Rhodanobacteraceae bacterium]|jgi:primosomal protein N' (replication factor Y)|nr:MAG: Helicase PriA essential for oriC/DnaA-independent DNA replication [Rhodanobacteraceae bacterium]